MERIIISGLEEGERFLMLDAVGNLQADGICGKKIFREATPYLLLESAAQLCALHSRWKANFSRHAFLLGMHEAVYPNHTLSGPVFLQATVDSFSEAAAQYRVRVTNNGEIYSLSLVIASMSYGKQFQEDLLRSRYQAIFYRLNTVWNKEAV